MTKDKTRKFNGKIYELATDQNGTNSNTANTVKASFKKRGYSVRIVVDGSKPYIYPEGRWYVYIRKPESKTIRVPVSRAG